MQRNRDLTAMFPDRNHLISCVAYSCLIRVSSSDAGNESDASGDWASHVDSLLWQHAINASPHTVSVLILGHISISIHPASA